MLFKKLLWISVPRDPGSDAGVGAGFITPERVLGDPADAIDDSLRRDKSGPYACIALWDA